MARHLRRQLSERQGVPMKTKEAFSWGIICFVLFSFGSSWAEENRQVLVISEVKHDISPPLRSMKIVKGPAETPHEFDLLTRFPEGFSGSPVSDTVLHTEINPPLMPSPIANFEGIGQGI